MDVGKFRANVSAVDPRISALAAFVLINSTAMENRGRLIAPGGLRDETWRPSGPRDDSVRPGSRWPRWPRSTACGRVRPGLGWSLTLVKVWQRRHFILAYATARNVSMYTEARLGQLWQVLTPLLNSAVYYLIFGVLFKANRGISNYTAYLVTGVFIFAFTERSIVVGSTVIRSNITLIRALHFPRACLPLAYVLVEFQQLLLSMVVLFAIVLGTGEPLTWQGVAASGHCCAGYVFNLRHRAVHGRCLEARLGRPSAGADSATATRPCGTFCGIHFSGRRGASHAPPSGCRGRKRRHRTVRSWSAPPGGGRISLS